MSRIKTKKKIENMIKEEINFVAVWDYYLDFPKFNKEILGPSGEKIKPENLLLLCFPSSKGEQELNKIRSEILDFLKKKEILHFNSKNVYFVFAKKQKSKPEIEISEDVLLNRKDLSEKIRELINKGKTFKRKGLKLAKDYLSRNM